MARVYNRYYNSPAIEAIGQNLAGILAPPDPAQQLAQKRAQFQFDREQELAAQQNEDRAREERLRGAFGDVATATTDAQTINAAAPASDMLSSVFQSLPFGAGKGPAAFLDQQRDLGSAVSNNTTTDATRRAYVEGATPQQIESLTGSKYANQRALRELMGEQQWARLMAMEYGKDNRLGVTEGGKDSRAEENSDLRILLKLLDAQRQSTHDASVTARGGGTALDVSPAEGDSLGYALEDWAESKGVTLPPDQLYAGRTIATDVYQRTRNATAGLDAAKVALFGTNDPTPDPGNPDPIGPNNWLGFIGATPKPASFRLRGNMTAQQIIEEYNRSRTANAAPAAATTPALSSSFDSVLQGLPGSQLPGMPGADAQPVLVRSPEEARALPAGTKFITTDGRTGTR